MPIRRRQCPATPARRNHQGARANRGEGFAVKGDRGGQGTRGLASVAVYAETPTADASNVGSPDEGVRPGRPGGPRPSRHGVEEAPGSYSLLSATRPRNPAPNAIHPGYGSLENRPTSRRPWIDAGLIWIRPSPQSDPRPSATRSRPVTLARKRRQGLRWSPGNGPKARQG